VTIVSNLPQPPSVPGDKMIGWRSCDFGGDATRMIVADGFDAMHSARTPRSIFFRRDRHGQSARGGYRVRRARLSHTGLASVG
jgi:hypothetical protein